MHLPTELPEHSYGSTVRCAAQILYMNRLIEPGDIVKLEQEADAAGGELDVSVLELLLPHGFEVQDWQPPYAEPTQESVTASWRALGTSESTISRALTPTLLATIQADFANTQRIIALYPGQYTTIGRDITLDELEVCLAEEWVIVIGRLPAEGLTLPLLLSKYNGDSKRVVVFEPETGLVYDTSLAKVMQRCLPQVQAFRLP